MNARSKQLVHRYPSASGQILYCEHFIQSSHLVAIVGLYMYVCRFWVMPSILLKNVIMGNLHKPTNDAAISDSVDFISDTVILLLLLLLLLLIIITIIIIIIAFVCSANRAQCSVTSLICPSRYFYPKLPLPPLRLKINSMPNFAPAMQCCPCEAKNHPE